MHVAPKKKMEVAGSLMLSKETYTCGAYPIVITGEQQKLHTNALITHREALCEGLEKGQPRRADPDLIHVHEARTPYVVVRPAGPRLSIRIICKTIFSFFDPREN